jgi:cytochrome c oxidase subunit I+III
MLLALTALLALIGLLMAGYIFARNSRGMIVRPRNSSLDLCALFVTYAVGQGALTIILTRVLAERPSDRKWLIRN